MRERRTRPRSDDGLERKAFAPLGAQRLFEHSRDRELRHSAAHLWQRALERPTRDVRRILDALHLLRILSFAQRLHEIVRRPPLPARAGAEEPLEVAMEQLRGL